MLAFQIYLIVGMVLVNLLIPGEPKMDLGVRGFTFFLAYIMVVFFISVFVLFYPLIIALGFIYFKKLNAFLDKIVARNKEAEK